MTKFFLIVWLIALPTVAFCIAPPQSSRVNCVKQMCELCLNFDGKVQCSQGFRESDPAKEKAEALATGFNNNLSNLYEQPGAYFVVDRLYNSVKKLFCDHSATKLERMEAEIEKMKSVGTKTCNDSRLGSAGSPRKASR